MDQTLTLNEVIARMEELAREFGVSAGNPQRGFEILREFFRLNDQSVLLKEASHRASVAAS